MISRLVAFLHEVAGVAEIGHDPERGSLGHAEPRRQVTQSSVWLSASNSIARACVVRKLQSPGGLVDQYRNHLANFIPPGLYDRFCSSAPPPWAVCWGREGSPPWTWWEWS